MLLVTAGGIAWHAADILLVGPGALSFTPTPQPPISPFNAGHSPLNLITYFCITASTPMVVFMCVCILHGSLYLCHETKHGHDKSLE